MENATKALLMAAGVLIGILILSMGVYLYYSIGGYVSQTRDKIQQQSLDKFNTQFYNYLAGNNNEFAFQDVVTAANLAYENNNKYDFPIVKFDSSFCVSNITEIESSISGGNDNYVQVVLDECLIGTNATKKSNVNLEWYVGNSRALSIVLGNNYKSNYKCTAIESGQESKRVCKLIFKKIN